MEAVELRTLDGPNLFMLRPAIKIEIVASPNASASDLARRSLHDDEMNSESGPLAIGHAVRDVLLELHQNLNLAPGEIVVRMLEEPGHVAIAFGWSLRSVSRAIGNLAWRIVSGDTVEIETELEAIRDLTTQPVDDDELPEALTESERRVPIIAVTGTNGKTTTTRLIASILRRSGNRVGWTSSAGVMIDDALVLAGDYTGPSGARRVFDESGIDVAVLETARGGILLRGLGYEHNDVSVMTNISADHMGMHGVHSLDVLTEVKSVVARVTVESGHVVLNADDPHVLSVRNDIVARPFLFSRSEDNAEFDAHIEAGGWALRASRGAITWHHDGKAEEITLLEDVPITFDGRAVHMVENALAAAAACLAIGQSRQQVRDGLKAFRNRPDENRGRLNVFEHQGATVVIDFAHNEAGLEHLLTFARSYCGDEARLVVVIGTAGDREDSAIAGIGRLAAEHADAVIIKDSEKYLRGRAAGEMPAILKRVAGDRVVQESPNERSAFYAGVDLLEEGDVLAVMCIEDSDEILAYLDTHAISLS